jgi:hypothetical protein
MLNFVVVIIHFFTNQTHFHKLHLFTNHPTCVKSINHISRKFVSNFFQNCALWRKHFHELMPFVIQPSNPWFHLNNVVACMLHHLRVNIWGQLMLLDPSHNEHICSHVTPWKVTFIFSKWHAKKYSPYNLLRINKIITYLNVSKCAYCRLQKYNIYSQF